MFSMTGYGRSDLRTRQISISTEISSVNNRYLEFFFRVPRQLSFLEPKVKELVSSKIERGRINITINYEDYGLGIDKVALNRGLAEDIYAQLKKLQKDYGLKGDIKIEHFLTFSDLFKVTKSEDLEQKVWPLMSKALLNAITQVISMRKREGANLKKDISARLKHLKSWISKINKLAELNFELYREKLNKRIDDALNGRQFDKTRLEEEIAYLAERADISEECVRFGSHLKQFEANIRQSGVVGRRLNFILQELNREANTIGAKSANPEISHLVVDIKEEIEKIREQVQNIE